MKYKQIMTNDNSTTFFNEEVKETYHSTSGAEEEARKKYAEPLKKYLNKKQKIVIYDVCFGIGYNTAATLDEIPEHELKIYCFENDKGILQKIPLLNPNFKSYPLIKELIHNFLIKKENNKLKTNKQELEIKIGDVQKTIQEDIENADYILFDPFSPKKTPELWTKEMFTKLFQKLNNGGILLTYSCAKHVRENMKQAGFTVIDGPIVGRKSPSTIAQKSK